LRKKIKVLREANEILKKSGGHLRAGSPPVTAYRFIRENRNRSAVRETTGLFGASRSACYRRATPGVSIRLKERDAEPVRLMRKIVHHYRYGSPRVREELRRDCGKRAGLKKSAALTRKNGL
jgi:hypothetical protein